MRSLVVVAAAVLVVACAKKENQSDNAAAADTMAMTAPAAPAPLSLADVKGVWHLQTRPADKDTVIAGVQLWLPEDTTAWKLKFDGRNDTIKVHIAAMAGDSMVIRFGPYPSALRKNVMVVTEDVYRLQNGKLMGHATAHYNVSTPDSVVHLRTEGTRVQ